MSEMTWQEVKSETDAQRSYTLFHNIFLDNYNKCFPYNFFLPQYYTRLPWITIGIKKAIENKNRLYIKSMKIRTTKSIADYNFFLNKLNHILRISERNYFQNQIKIHKNNLRKSWAVIKNVINRNK
jgi:hypothetical protein